MSAEAKRQEDVMVVLFRLVAFMAKHKLSLRLYEELVVLLQQSGVDVGDTDRPRTTAREMNEVIAGYGRGYIKEFIETPSYIFGRRPNIGVAADKLSDLAQKQSQMVMIRLNFKGTPLTLLAKTQSLILAMIRATSQTDNRASVSYARSLSLTGLIYLKRRKHLQMGPSLNGEVRILAMATEDSGVHLRLTAKVFTTALVYC
jgi:hypothetical protein